MCSAVCAFGGREGCGLVQSVVVWRDGHGPAVCAPLMPPPPEWTGCHPSPSCHPHPLPAKHTFTHTHTYTHSLTPALSHPMAQVPSLACRSCHCWAALSCRPSSRWVRWHSHGRQGRRGGRKGSKRRSSGSSSSCRRLCQEAAAAPCVVQCLLLPTTAAGAVHCLAGHSTVVIKRFVGAAAVAAVLFCMCVWAEKPQPVFHLAAAASGCAGEEMVSGRWWQ